MLAAILSKLFFQRIDDQQRRAVLLRRLGVTDLTVAAAVGEAAPMGGKGS
jgi:hypothetical protein